MEHLPAWEMLAKHAGGPPQAHAPCTRLASAMPLTPTSLSLVFHHPATATTGTGLAAMRAVRSISFASKLTKPTKMHLVTRLILMIQSAQSEHIALIDATA